VNDQEGKAILRRWPDTTSLFRWRGDRKVVKAHPPSPLAPLATLGVQSSKTYADGAYVNLQWTGSQRMYATADVLFIEVCGSLANLGDKRSRYLPRHEARCLTLQKKWFNKSIRWAGGTERQIFRAIGLSDCPNSDVYALVRALRVLYVLEDNHFGNLIEDEVPRGYEFFASDSWFRSTVPDWPESEPAVGWNNFNPNVAAFPPGPKSPRDMARKFFDLNQHFLR
jgi:hypothetical protein